jgi:Trk K+ transport system NAD-binding subunit
MIDFEKVLRDLGLTMEMAMVREGAAAVGMTVEELEKRGKGAFFVVQIDPREGDIVTRPPGDAKISAGDGLVVVGRLGSELNAVFTAPAAKARAGRTTF